MKNMKRYIDAYKIPYHDLSDGRGKCEVAFLEDIIKVPTADVRENIKSEWKVKYTGDGWSDYIDVTCMHCYKTIKRGELYNFCPHCGAAMKRKKNYE